MRLRGLRRCAAPVRCALLSRLDPLHHLRPRGRLPVSLGGIARQDRRLWLLVDDHLPRGPDGWLHLRMEEGSPRMGMSGNVSVTPTSLTANGLAQGPAQDRILRAVNDELTDKGFVVAQMDKLVNWARTGSLWPMTF